MLQKGKKRRSKKNETTAIILSILQWLFLTISSDITLKLFHHLQQLMYEAPTLECINQATMFFI